MNRTQRRKLATRRAMRVKHARRHLQAAKSLGITRAAAENGMAAARHVVSAMELLMPRPQFAALAGAIAAREALA